MSTALHTAHEALQQRANVVTESRKMLEATLGAGREMTAEERTKYDAMEADIVRLGTLATELQKQEKREAEMRARSDEPIRPNLSGKEERAGNPEGAPADKATVPEWRKRALSFYSRAEDMPGSSMRFSERGLQADSATGGGYLIKKEHLSDLIRELDNVVYLRQKARKIRLAMGDSIDMPTLAAKPNSFAWGTELGKPPADSAMKYGRRILTPKPARGLITVSRKMLRLADPPADVSVREEFGA